MENKLNLKNINTKRLILVPLTLELTKSLMLGQNEELEKLGIKQNEKWPTEDTYDILPIIAESLEQTKVPTGFETWMIIRNDNNQVIGDIGFHGKPDENGEVEVGYGLVEDERKKGFGFEALEAIMTWAISQSNVKIIKADCLIDNIPSARLLEKVGLKEINRDEELIYWELIKPIQK